MHLRRRVSELLVGLCQVCPTVVSSPHLGHKSFWGILMGVIIQFNFQQWQSMFSPHFDKVEPGIAQNYFEMATQYCRNDGGGPIGATSWGWNSAVFAQSAIQTQTNILYLLTAHIARLLSDRGGEANIVGRITNASEGSVSVGAENQYPPGTAQWFQQTQYGAMAWQAMLPYRTMRYKPPRFRRIFNPYRYPF